MFRPKHALLYAIAPLLLAAVPIDDPPSSLEPGAPRGKVRFFHVNKKAVSCEAKAKAQKTVCRASRELADSATTLKLRPVSDSRTISGNDKRQTVTLSLPSQHARVDKRIELGVGDWEIDWAERSKHERFRVGDGDEYDISLRTLTGSCKKKQDLCALDTEPKHYKVVVPVAHTCGN